MHFQHYFENAWFSAFLDLRLPLSRECVCILFTLHAIRHRINVIIVNFTRKPSSKYWLHPPDENQSHKFGYAKLPEHVNHFNERSLVLTKVLALIELMHLTLDLVDVILILCYDSFYIPNFTSDLYVE